MSRETKNSDVSKLLTGTVCITLVYYLSIVLNLSFAILHVTVVLSLINTV